MCGWDYISIDNYIYIYIYIYIYKIICNCIRSYVVDVMECFISL